MSKLRNAIVVTVLVSVFFFTAAAHAMTPLEECLQYIPSSSIFVVVSQDGARAYENYKKYGVCEAFPDLKTLISNYENKSGVTINEELNQSNCYLLSLSEINPMIMSFEFITAMSVKDIRAYNKMIDKWVAAYNAKRIKVTSIAGHEVYSISSPEIKTPLFYLTTDNIIISSNKLEGLSKALDIKRDNAKNFLKSIYYEQVKRKFNMDSNLYIWISGRVISDYLKLFGSANPALFTAKGEAAMKIFNYFTEGLEFIAMKKSLTETGAESDIFISMNETVARVIKAKLDFAKFGKKLSYAGIEFDSLKAIPEACEGFAAAHILLPPFEELMNSANTQFPNLNAKTFNDRLVKKFKAGLDVLVYPWVGEEYFAAQFPGSKGHMAGVKIADMEKFEKALRKVENKMYSTNYRVSVSKYKGVTVKTAAKRVKKGENKNIKSYFVIGDYAIVTSNPEMASVIIDTFNDRLPSVRMVKGFVESCDYAAGNKYKILSWLKTETAFAEILPYLGGFINVSTADPSKIQLKNMGVTNYMTNGGQHIKIKVTY